MFVLTPVSALHPHVAQPHYRPPVAHPYYRPFSPNRREMYMAAVAEARNAEIQYMAELAREEAVRREREREAQRQRWLGEAVIRRQQRDELVRRQILASMGAIPSCDSAYSIDSLYDRRYDPAFIPTRPSFCAPRQHPAFCPEERIRDRRHAFHHQRENEQGRRVRFQEPREWQRPRHHREEWASQERQLNPSREDQDITPEQFFNLLFGGRLAHEDSTETARVKVTPPAQSSAQGSSSKAPVPTSSAPPTEGRLPNQEAFEQELCDTFQAIMLSFLPTDDEAQPPKEATKPTSESNSATERKGKGKATAVQSDVTSVENTSWKVPTSKDVAFSLETIRNVDASFQAIQSDFEFPHDLDFDRTSPILPSSISQSDSNYKLAYTSRNAPVRYFEHAMSALLTQLDAVDSFGNEGVRVERRVVVSKIERALEEVEKEVEEKLGKFKWKESRNDAETSVSNTGISKAEKATDAKPVEVTTGTDELRELSVEVSSGGDAPSADLKPDSSIHEQNPAPSIDDTTAMNDEKRESINTAIHPSYATQSIDEVEEVTDVSESAHEASQAPVEIIVSVAAAPEKVVAALEIGNVDINRGDVPRPSNATSTGSDLTQSVVPEDVKEIEQSISVSSSSTSTSSSPSSSSSTPEILSSPSPSSHVSLPHIELALVDVDPDVTESLPPASSVSPSSLPSSINSESQSDEEDVDTFLLPAPSRPADAAHDDELIVVENLSDQDGDSWSEVEA